MAEEEKSHWVTNKGIQKAVKKAKEEIETRLYKITAREKISMLRISLRETG